ncbi:membrane protein [Dictyobacter alpinus]|uniref:Membrane protein n=1 Tax=Dictyobacter alpinus TaxID=2014873 RepID=A0A402BCG8_9CHLR|nr:hypothetical protein [Dictyobacter alpinus]GCE29000.1 membrane protein [Dictyobacter alpinus]
MNVYAIYKAKFIAQDWVNYFKGNALLRQPIAWEQGISVEAALRGPLVRSLQRFQVGEQGDGLHLRQAAARTLDTHYIAAIDLFVKEEQLHSRLLAGIIEGLGGSLLEQHWSDTCFVWLRRLMGLRMELLVLLLVEVIAQVYYKALHDGTNDAVLRSVFAQIMQDEHGHVTFHCSYLRQSFSQLSPLARWSIYTGWRFLFMLVCCVFIYDHRSVLRAVGITPRTCWRDCMQAFQKMRIFTAA